MLSKLKTFAAVVVVAMAFVGCTKEETSMSIYDLAGRAKIKGFVSYNAKDSLQEDGYIEGFWMPKSGVEILAKISNADISGDTTNMGYTEFKTRTNEEGYYEFELPVPEKATKVILQAETFEGVRCSYDSLKNKELSCSDKEGVFSCFNETLTVKPNEIVYRDLYYAFSQSEISSQSSTLTVNVFKGVYVNGVPTFIRPQWTPFNVTIKDNDGNISETKMTNDTGSVKFDILHLQERMVGLTISVEKSSSSTLDKPYEWEDLDSFWNLGEELEGTYEQFYYIDYSNWNKNKAKWKIWDEAWHEIDTVLEQAEEKLKPWVDEEKFNDYCLTTKKRIWINRTGVEWNDQWNNKNWEDWKSEMIKGIWDASFKNQREFVSYYANSEGYNGPILEDYPVWDFLQPYEEYQAAVTKWKEDFEIWKIEFERWWKYEKDFTRIKDNTINIYMVFRPDDIEDYYKHRSEYAYEYYLEWIDAFVDAKTKINNGAKQ